LKRLQYKFQMASRLLGFNILNQLPPFRVEMTGRILSLFMLVLIGQLNLSFVGRMRTGHPATSNSLRASGTNFGPSQNLRRVWEKAWERLRMHTLFAEIRFCVTSIRLVAKINRTTIEQDQGKWIIWLVPANNNKLHCQVQIPPWTRHSHFHREMKPARLNSPVGF